MLRARSTQEARPVSGDPRHFPPNFDRNPPLSALLSPILQPAAPLFFTRFFVPVNHAISRADCAMDIFFHQYVL
jgi:hypothetical protein